MYLSYSLSRSLYFTVCLSVKFHLICYYPGLCCVPFTLNSEKSIYALEQKYETAERVVVVRDKKR